MEILANRRTSALGIFVASVLLLMSACTGSQYSSQQITEAEGVIQQVEEVEAMDYAQPEFQEAQMKLEEARQMAEKGKHKKAGLKASEARAAAELAEAKTLSTKAEESLTELAASIQSLKDQLEEYQQENQEEE